MNVLVARKDRITTITINRPEVRNAVDGPTAAELADAFRSFDADEGSDVAVLTGAGGHFCAGADLKAISAGTLPNRIEETGDGPMGPSRMLLSKPVIAAVHSHCLGGGVDLLSACDIRIASADAVFSVREVKVAFIADVGTLQRLPHIIGHGWFRELALTGRDFSAEEALKIGFITRICPDREPLIAAPRSLAEEIAACSPLAVQGTKDVL